MTRAITRVLTPAALLFAATLTLAGCSFAPPAGPDTDNGPDTTEETAPEPGADAATGELISGDGYTFNVPEGWGDPGQEIPGFDPDAFAANLSDDDGFTDNINVLLSPAGSLTPEQVEGAGVAELEGAGATQVEALDRVTVGGSESAHLRAMFSQSGTEYWVEQFYPTDGGQTYVVTFSFSPTVSEGDRAAVYEAVLASWTWV